MSSNTFTKWTVHATAFIISCDGKFRLLNYQSALYHQHFHHTHFIAFTYDLILKTLPYSICWAS